MFFWGGSNQIWLQNFAITGINYNQFADQLIQGTKSNFYKQIKKVGGMKVPNKKMFISSLDGQSDKYTTGSYNIKLGLAI